MKKKNIYIFLQSIQVDMKNVVKFSSDFFPYFEALYTNSDIPWLNSPTVKYLLSKKPISSSKGKEYRLSKPKYL